MARKSKNTIPEKTINFKINTRIIISSVLAIVIPVLILTLAAIIFVVTSMDRYNISSVNTENYSVLNQVQWSQAVSNIASALADEENDSDKQNEIESTTKKLEELGSVIYIENEGKIFYSTKDPQEVINEANAIDPISLDKSSYYYGDSGIVIVNSVETKEGQYIIVAANSNYRVPDVDSNYAPQHILESLTNNAATVMGVCVATFIAAIIILSLLTSKTIIGPIEKITKGANEIAKGNLDYEIDYHSTNELGQLAQSFNDMRLRVKELIDGKNKADQQQKEMIAGIAHDLRTPLTSIEGYLEGIKDGVADTKEKQIRYLDTIYDSAVSMEKMLNDLLTLSKLELGSITLNCEEVRISDFLSFAKEIGQELKKHDFDYIISNNTKSDPILFIDTDRFSRVVNNIISNSIKYRRKDVRGKISLIISEYEHSVIFEIADNGMGVDSKSLSRIFDTLYRADKARSNVSDGSGLGLAVCKQIVELHKGMIWAQTNAEKGLSIFISLPKTEEPEVKDNEKDTDN